MTQSPLIMLCTDNGSMGQTHSSTVLNDWIMVWQACSFVPRWPWWPNQSCASLLSSLSIYYWLIYNICKSDTSGNRLKVPFAVTRHRFTFVTENTGSLGVIHWSQVLQESPNLIITPMLEQNRTYLMMCKEGSQQEWLLSKTPPLGRQIEVCGTFCIFFTIGRPLGKTLWLHMCVSGVCVGLLCGINWFFISF